MYLKLSKILKKIAFVLRSKSIYYELKHYIKRNETYIKKIDYFDRRIGKTHSLVKLATQFKCPIIVPKKHYTQIVKNMVNGNIEVISYNEFNIRGRKFDKVLCDEGLDM